MRVQIQFKDGSVINEVLHNSLNFMEWMEGKMQRNVEKMSFDFIDGARLALNADGTYQIFGGLVNYPHLTENDR